jgi:hypothetical protein
MPRLAISNRSCPGSTTMLIALNLHAGERQIRVNAEATTEAADGRAALGRRQGDRLGGRPVSFYVSQTGNRRSGRSAEIAIAFHAKRHDFGSGNRKFESSRPSHCRVSGHGGHMSQLIVDNSRTLGGGSQGLVIAGGIED